MSLIDRQFLFKLIVEGLIVDIKKMPTAIKVRSLGINQHDASEYINLFIYVLGSNSTVLITREIYIVDNLSVNMLLRIDVIKPEGIMLDL